MSLSRAKESTRQTRGRGLSPGPSRTRQGHRGGKHGENSPPRSRPPAGGLRGRHGPGVLSKASPDPAGPATYAAPTSMWMELSLPACPLPLGVSARMTRGAPGHCLTAGSCPASGGSVPGPRRPQHLGTDRGGNAGHTNLNVLVKTTQQSPDLHLQPQTHLWGGGGWSCPPCHSAVALSARGPRSVKGTSALMVHLGEPGTGAPRPALD